MPRPTNSALLLALCLAAVSCGITQPRYIDYSDDNAATDAADGATDGAADGDADGSSDAGGDGAPSDVTYAGAAKALIDGKCATAGCHVSGAQPPDLSTYDSAKANGPRSQFRISAGTMPTSGPLSDAEKSTFKAWVDADYPQ